MIPGCFDWPDQYAGDTSDIRAFSLREKGSDTPIDLTGCIVRMQARLDAQRPAVIDIASDTGSEIQITDPAGGTFTIGGFRNPDQSGAYLYDIEVEFTDGSVTTYLKGFYPVHMQVTR